MVGNLARARKIPGLAPIIYARAIGGQNPLLKRVRVGVGVDEVRTTKKCHAERSEASGSTRRARCFASLRMTGLIEQSIVDSSHDHPSRTPATDAVAPHWLEH